jgi:uncharacterized protein
MNRILVIMLLFIGLIATAHAQPTKNAKKKPTTKTNVPRKKTPSGIDTTSQEYKDLMRQLALLSDTSTQVHKDFMRKMDSLTKDMEIMTKQPRNNNTRNAAKQNRAMPLQPLGWVNDFVDLFTPAQQTELDSLIAAFEKATTVEIAIVTIDSAGIDKKNFDDYVTAIGKRWGVGKKETNNGVVIGICPGFRLIRISTGLGIMQQLTDQEAKTIIDDIIVPQYRLGDYFNGTKLGLLAVMQELR